jgi:TctA family transporter
VVRGAFPLLSFFQQRGKTEWCSHAFLISSGIFGYINYLVERDRQFIIDTLLNGMFPTPVLLSLKSGEPLLI